MGVLFGEGNCYTRAFHHRTGRSLWQPTKPRNAHIRFVRVRSLRRSIAARSARRWKKFRTWIASAPIRSARVERNTRLTHSHRRRPARRIRSPFNGVSSADQNVADKMGPGTDRQHRLSKRVRWKSRLDGRHASRLGPTVDAPAARAYIFLKCMNSAGLKKNRSRRVPAAASGRPANILLPGFWIRHNSRGFVLGVLDVRSRWRWMESAGIF